ncbi:MAG: ABC transporter permease [Acidobacteriota bacterium]
MDRLLQDLRYGLRMLANNPGFTAVAVITLALGIGANTSIFSLVNALLLRPLPRIQEPDRLVAIYTTHDGRYTGVSSYMDYLDFRQRNEVFEDLAVYKPLLMDLSSEDLTERVQGMIVSASYFSVLGVQPARGRFFLPEEDRTPGTEAVAVLGYGLWQLRFGADPGIVGRSVVLNGRAFTVVGVAPEGFRGTDLEEVPEIFAPMMMQPHFMPAYGNLLERRGWGGILIVGRLRQQATLSQARANLATLSAWLKQEYPRTTEHREYSLVPFTQAAVSPEARADVVRLSWLLLGVVGMVLLIACVNVANLLLARSSRRRREIAVRQAIGAARGRLVRQLLLESVTLSLFGGAAGLLLGVWSNRFLRALPLPFHLDLSLDLRILAFTFLLSLLTGVLFGVAPALEATRAHPASHLRAAVADGGRAQGRRWGNVLVVAQVALSLLLLIAAGLFARTLINLGTIELGFDAKNVLVATLDPALQGYEGTEVLDFYQRLMDRIDSLPGVGAASLVSNLPGPGNDDVTSIAVEGYDPGPGNSLSISFNLVGVNYFRTMGIPILRGRAFSDRDDRNAPQVAVINETAARAFRQSTGRDELGARVSSEGPEGPFVEVIGIAADSKTGNLRADPVPLIYLLQRQLAMGNWSRMTLLVRTGGDPLGLLPSVRAAVEAIDPNIPVFNVGTLEAHLAITLVQERLSATLLVISALLALLLAAVGLYGVLSYSVSQRTRELGLRMALGAHAGDLLKSVVWQGMMLVASGVLIGLLAAFAAARLLSSFLFGVTGTDPLTYLGVSALLAAVSLLASYLPARRATRVDPMIALRSE